MYSMFSIGDKWIRYFLRASNSKGHGIHSPFVYEFVTAVLNDAKTYPGYAPIETLRKALLQDHRVLEIEDFGAGSAIEKTNRRKLSSVARTASKSHKFGSLLFRMARYYPSTTMVELGTCLGISSSWLALANPHSKLYTLEGSTALAGIARENFANLGLENIELREGRFEDSLPALLDSLESVDLAFIDGNHRLVPTLHYFDLLKRKISESGLIIFDDIHWSKEMGKAWAAIKNDPETMLSVDLFFMGVVFFDRGFKVKQHFELRF
ncbi:MAG: O-methyltransferase [Chitinophagales bacterium]